MTKKIKIFTAAVALLMMAASCSKDDSSVQFGAPGITFTAIPSNNNEIYFYAIAQQLVVDWGDGSAPETYTYVIYDFEDSNYNNNDKITHTYASSNTYTVHIKGEGLTHFDCSGNQLTALNVRGCPTLEWLGCFDNQLTALDVRGCAALEWLGCFDNQLTALDVSKCPALQWLYCYNNQLTALDVSGCSALQTLSCGDNQLTATALNTVFTALPNRSNYGGHISISNNPGTNSCDMLIAFNKGWMVIWE